MPDHDDTARPSPRWQVSPRALWRALPDGVLVLGAHMAVPVALTGPASSLWNLLDEHPTRHEIVARLADSYDVTEARVDIDLTDAWHELVDQGLVEHAPSSNLDQPTTTRRP